MWVKIGLGSKVEWPATVQLFAMKNENLKVFRSSVSALKTNVITFPLTHSLSHTHTHSVPHLPSSWLRAFLLNQLRSKFTQLEERTVKSPLTSSFQQARQTARSSTDHTAQATQSRQPTLLTLRLDSCTKLSFHSTMLRLDNLPGIKLQEMALPGVLTSA